MFNPFQATAPLAPGQVAPKPPTAAMSLLKSMGLEGVVDAAEKLANSGAMEKLIAFAGEAEGFDARIKAVEDAISRTEGQNAEIIALLTNALRLLEQPIERVSGRDTGSGRPKRARDTSGDADNGAQAEHTTD